MGKWVWYGASLHLSANLLLLWLNIKMAVWSLSTPSTSLASVFFFSLWPPSFYGQRFTLSRFCFCGKRSQRFNTWWFTRQTQDWTAWSASVKWYEILRSLSVTVWPVAKIQNSTQKSRLRSRLLCQPSRSELIMQLSQSVCGDRPVVWSRLSGWPKQKCC